MGGWENRKKGERRKINEKKENCMYTSGFIVLD